jgi:hypothetical protein
MEKVGIRDIGYPEKLPYITCWWSIIECA